MPNIFQQISRGIDRGNRKASAHRGKSKVIIPRNNQRFIKPTPKKSSSDGGSNVESFDEPRNRR